MAKIVTKRTSSIKNDPSKSGTIFERSIIKEVKGLKTILANNEKSINDIKNSLKNFNKKSFNKSKEDKGLFGATEISEEKRKNSATLKVNKTLESLHKSIIELLSPKKKEKKEENFLSKLLKKVFSLSTLFKAALATLPFIFQDTLKALLSKGLEKLGVGKELSKSISNYLLPAIEGAGIGYLLFRNAKGIIAGAVVGAGYAFIDKIINDWKASINNPSGESGKWIDGLGTLTKSVIIGAGLGFGFLGFRGMIAGAVVGAVAGSIVNLITQWKDNVENPKIKTSSDYFSNLGRGALYGGIIGAIIGSKFGGGAGLLVGVAAGAIIGGASGVISTLISNFKAKHAIEKQYTPQSKVYKNYLTGNFTEADIKAQEEKIELLEAQISETEDKEKKQQLLQEQHKAEVDLNLIERSIADNKKLTLGAITGESQYDWYVTKGGKLVDLNAKQGFWRNIANGIQLSSHYTSFPAFLHKLYRYNMGLLQKDDSISVSEYTKSFREKEKAFYKEWKAHRIATAEVPGSSLTYGSEENQKLLKSIQAKDLETINYNKIAYSDIKEQENKVIKDLIDKNEKHYVDNANRELIALEQIEKHLANISNSYNSFPVNNTSNPPSVNGLNPMQTF